MGELLTLEEVEPESSDGEPAQIIAAQGFPATEKIAESNVRSKTPSLEI